MSISLLLASILAHGPVHSNQRHDSDFFDDLLQWREQFETALIEPTTEIGYVHVHSEMLGGAHADALYPLGSASERFVLFFGEGGSGGTLMYQRRHGNQAKVDWYAPFVPTKSKTSVRGTVRSYLQRLGFEISPRAKITSTMRRQLAVRNHYAAYSYHPMMGGYANVVYPDGTVSKTVRSPDRYSITAEEKRLWARRR